MNEYKITFSRVTIENYEIVKTEIAFKVYDAANAHYALKEADKDPEYEYWSVKDITKL